MLCKNCKPIDISSIKKKPNWVVELCPLHSSTEIVAEGFRECLLALLENRKVNMVEMGIVLQRLEKEYGLDI